MNRLEKYADDAEKERYHLMELANTRRIAQQLLEKKANQLRRTFAWLQSVRMKKVICRITVI